MPSRRLQPSMHAAVWSRDRRLLKRFGRGGPWIWGPCRVAARQPTGEELTSDAAVTDVLERLVAAWNRGDIETVLDAYWKDDGVRFASGSDVIYGFAAIEKRFHEAYPDPAAMGRLEFSGLEIARPSDTAAVVFGRWQIARDVGELEGLFTVHLRRLDGQWVIVSDHTSSG